MNDKERIVKALDEAKEGTSVDLSTALGRHMSLTEMENKEYDVVEFPKHYNKGEIDLIEAWSRLYPENEFRAGMQMMTMRYLFRDKDNKIQDLNKAKEFIERQIEFEERKDK